MSDDETAGPAEKDKLVVALLDAIEILLDLREQVYALRAAVLLGPEPTFVLPDAK